MKVLIVEDEQPAYKRLAKLVTDSIPAAQLAGHTDSIAATKEWLQQNPVPDLVFLDIHLADGSAFDLLKLIHISSPIIFTTAYDQYALEAFKTQGIGYILKPVKQDDLVAAVAKLEQFKNLFGKEGVAVAQPTPEYKKRFVIRFGEHIKTLAVEDIAYCYSESKATFARSFEGRSYPMDHNLDALEHLLDPGQFFRINRQYLINLHSIDEMKSYSKARVIVSLKPTVKDAPVVSSERAADFKLWLGGDLG